MACSAKQRNRVIIRRYDQLSEFGYCLHNWMECVVVGTCHLVVSRKSYHALSKISLSTDSAKWKYRRELHAWDTTKCGGVVHGPLEGTLPCDRVAVLRDVHHC
jgi:hypothetical protein